MLSPAIGLPDLNTGAATSVGIASTPNGAPGELELRKLASPA
jgi:hypothetical protein